MATVRWWTLAAPLAPVLAILAVGLAAGGWLQNILLVSTARGVAVLTLVVLWRAGLVSFGHALYFGLGAYSVAILREHAGVQEAALLILAGGAVAAAVGVAAGFLVRRYRGIFFAMLNLAFSMILYGAIIKSSALGSTDGFSVGSVTVLGVGGDPGLTRTWLFVLTGLVAMAAVVVVAALLNAPIGRCARAIQDNEVRVEYLGVSVEGVIHVYYALSALFTGIAGALLALSLGQVDPDSMVNWTVSGELVFVTILSGAGGIVTPFIASLLFEILRTYAFELAPHLWHLIIGATLVAVIAVLPGGLASLPLRWRRAHG